jgi:aminoglycoside phosphotransferase family enzyme/predicted kinase
MTLPSPLGGLLDRAAYPHPADAVELIETHISWVLLAGEFAYKIMRPVHYSFIDLRDPARREQLCQEELRLNRRFAPLLYLDVCRVVQADGQVRMGGQGTVLAHAVRMRRFRRDEELDRLLWQDRVEPRELAVFGGELAAIHAQLPIAPSAASWGHPAQVQSLIIRNLLECAEAAGALGLSAPVLALQEPLQARLPCAAAVMAARRASGRVRECHGDLHSRNIVRLSGHLIAFDCLEYEAAFRWIDVADEIAFLSSDLAARDRPAHAHAFLSGYLEAGGDYQACRVVRLYEAHRALVRAKVAALSATPLQDGPQRAALLAEHARLVRHAQRSVGGCAPLLVLMHGLSGSGKTVLASQLAQALHAIHLRSDIERRRGAGPDAAQRAQAAPGAERYAPGATAAVYALLARAAEDILAGGYTVIVDATFLKRTARAQFVTLAAHQHVDVHMVCCRAPDAVLRERIAARRAAGTDASEADAAVLGWQQERQEPVAPGEPIEAINVDTTRPDALETVLRALAR